MAEAKSSAQGLSITQRYACWGADIARDSSRRNRERGVGPGEGGLGDRNCPVVHDRSRPASEQACDAEGEQGFCRCSLGDGWTTASRTRLLVLQVYFWTKNAADRQPEPELGLLLLTPEAWVTVPRSPGDPPSKACTLWPREPRSQCSPVPECPEALSRAEVCERRSSLNI